MKKLKVSSIEHTENIVLQTLIDHEILSLPVDLSKVLSNKKIAVYPLSSLKEICQKRNLPKYLNHDGFAVKIKEKMSIFINSSISSPQYERHVLAHEMGHILLGHLDAKSCTMPIDGEKEWQAYVFANRLLAPNCVLSQLGITDPRIIATMCDISLITATHKVHQFDRKSTPSALESKLLNQFFDFINSNKVTKNLLFKGK